MEETEILTADVETQGDASQATAQDTSAQDAPVETADTEFESAPQQDKTQEPQEEPEVAEFKGAVSARLRGIVKQAPELGQIFQKYPKLQEQIEATFRREAALREYYPTVAEARFMRETFPNGQPDVQAVLEDSRELEQMDRSFEERDASGAYPGHAEIVRNAFERSRDAAVSLMDTMLRDWPTYDRDSYNEKVGSVVGATLTQNNVPEFIASLLEEAKGIEEAKPIAAGIEKLLGWTRRYTADKPRPTEQEERLTRDRQSFEKQKQEASKADSDRFHNEFVSANMKLETDIVKSHPAIKKLLAVNSISEGKKQDIVEQIREATEQFLSKSPSFMRKLRPAYNNRNLTETTNLIRSAWSQPWLMNRMVRSILAKEVPQMVQNNREAVARRAGAARPVPPARTSDKPRTPSGPYQINGRWYRPNGSAFTTSEVLAGKHLT